MKNNGSFNFKCGVYLRQRRSKGGDGGGKIGAIPKKLER